MRKRYGLTRECLKLVPFTISSAVGATALMAAAGKGRLEDVAALLTAGADPLLRSRDGSSAQDWATKFGHSEVADFLAAHMEVRH